MWMLREVIDIVLERNVLTSEPTWGAQKCIIINLGFVTPKNFPVLVWDVDCVENDQFRPCAA